MNICYIVCYVRNKHRQKSVKKEPSIQTETLIDTYIRKLTKSLKYKITWSQTSALFNNVLGVPPGTLGADILKSGKLQLDNLYPHIDQVQNEKVLAVLRNTSGYVITTNKNEYVSKLVVIAIGYTNLLSIKGLESYVEPHPKAALEKNRIWLKNEDYLVDAGLYVAGTLAGGRSQFAIASGSGAQVATDILTLWNNGKHTKVHDKV